jgi:hypothetical protein
MLPTLPRFKRAATLRPVKYLSLLALTFLTGCQTYTHLAVTDLQGQPISDWVAEGRVHKVPEGYLIKAIERKTPAPDAICNRYPNGRAATVVGPNIILQEIEKPEWLSDMEIQ